MQARTGAGRDQSARWLTSALGAAVVFGVVLLLVRASAWLPRLDLEAARDLHRPMTAHPLLVDLADAVSLVLSPAVVRTAAGIAAVVLLLRRRYAAAALAAIGVIGSVGVTDGMKALIRRPRPAFPDPVGHASGWSFPSGHSLAAAAAATALIALVPVAARRRTAAVAVPLVVLVCASRMTLGVHYLSDVVAGAALGTAWVALCWTVLLAAGGGRARRIRGAPPSRGGRPSAAADRR